MRLPKAEYFQMRLQQAQASGNTRKADYFQARLDALQPAKLPTPFDNDPVYVISHSGGKDSQAMYLHLVHDLDISPDRIQVIHAELPGVDWEGSVEHIQDTIDHELVLVKSHKTFFDMVRSRSMFPSSQHRQCTSDLKRDPINKWIRNFCKETGEMNIINCMGIRAQESTARAKKDPLKVNTRMSAAGRNVIDWMPIFDWTTEQVFDKIASHAQEAFWTYAEGMTRKSCKFCILASKCDLQTAARLDPKGYQDILDLEEEVNHTFHNKGSLRETVDPKQEAA